MKKLSALIICLILAANIIVGTVVAAPNESSAEAEKLLIDFFNNNKNELAYGDYSDDIVYAFLADIDNDGNPELLFSRNMYWYGLTIYKVIDGKVTEMSNGISSGGHGTNIHSNTSLLLDNYGYMYLYTEFGGNPPFEEWPNYEFFIISEWTKDGEKTLKCKGFYYKLNYDGTFDGVYYSTVAPTTFKKTEELDNCTVKISRSEAKTIYAEFENLINIVWTAAYEYENGVSTDIWEKQKALYEKNSIDFDKRRIILQIGNSNMDVDGEAKPIDAEYNIAPIIKDERTLVPVRAIVEEIGGCVEWDSESCAATLSYGGTEIKLVIGKNIAYLNGVPHILDVAPIIENGRTMFPIRFIAENFGLDVKWKKLTNQIIVSEYDNHGNS